VQYSKISKWSPSSPCPLASRNLKDGRLEIIPAFGPEGGISWAHLV